jgi:hypothetical protein
VDIYLTTSTGVSTVIETVGQVTQEKGHEIGVTAVGQLIVATRLKSGMK